MRNIDLITAVLVGLFLTTGTADVAGQSIQTIAGTGVAGFSGDGGPAVDAQVNNVYGVARGPDGGIYFCDVDNHRIRRIDSAGVITTVAGNGTKGRTGDGGLATLAAIDEPYELAWDAFGNLFFVDRAAHCVRRIDAKTSVITTIAGNGNAGFSGDDSMAIDAEMNQPHSLAFGPQGNLFVCDIKNHRVREIDMVCGRIATWSGDGKAKTSADETAIDEASLHGPRAITFDGDGNGWLVLREGNAVLMMDQSSYTIRRIAGTGKKGFTGNGGPAIEATLSGPKGISIGGGRVYLADTESHSIRYIDHDDQTMQVLVSEKAGPLRTKLARPHGVFVDVDGSVLIGDSENHRVLRVTLD